MKRLDRYLLRQAFFLIAVSLGCGVGIYFLVDVFSRMPDLMEAEMEVRDILLYFGAKTPLIISQTLPAVFLLSLVLLLSLMRRNRELTALESGGVSPLRVLTFLLVYGLSWSVLQFFFSQVAGIKGEQLANHIWNTQVKERKINSKGIGDLWFRDGGKTLHINRFWPQENRGEGLRVYIVSTDYQRIETILEADSFQIQGTDWSLKDVVIKDPQNFSSTRKAKATFSLDKDVGALVFTRESKDDGTSFDPVSLPVWKLWSYIEVLQESGSNVERLQTSWHMKWAYAASLIVMALLAFSLASFFQNIYANVALSFVNVFLYFILFLAGTSAAQYGAIPP
ncbi:MAG: LptF/LptG family permease [Desulfovibrionales bacterium]